MKTRSYKEEALYKQYKKDEFVVREPLHTYHVGSQFNGHTKMLGLAGFHKMDSNDYIFIVRKGLSKKTMFEFMSLADLSQTEMASIVHISDRTLRRYTDDQLLSQDQTERLLLIARLYSKGEEVFGSLSSFREWMDSKILGIGDIKPKELLDTSLGIGMLMDELGRIEHGVLA
jgi:putative toxin-antitoxin system antitoxin component (TIGR02293 family)